MIRKILKSIIVKVALYKVDLLTIEDFINEDFEEYDFVVISDISMAGMLQSVREERGETFYKIAIERLNSGEFYCFSFVDKKNQEIAYLRWLRKNSFYHNTYKKEIILQTEEAFTLDSYTPIKYRGKGLHKEMNKRMLSYCKFEMKFKNIYMVILVGSEFEHLHKTVKEIGYRMIKTNSYIDFSYARMKIMQLFKK